MNATSRRDKIEAMLVDEPHDIFLQYSLALELEKEGDHSRSLELLHQLTEKEPPYIPAFFMSGQQLTKLGRVNEARSVLRDGIESARSTGDAHAAAEMSEFLQSLGLLGE